MPVIAERSWMPGPADPRLTEGSVHVWRVELAAVGVEVVELLSDDERARGERLLSARDRRLWMRSRGVLRVLLGRYLQIDPGTLRFSAGEHGKPRLRPAGPSFNLAHSGELALCAVAERGAVGVDVEVARRPIKGAALAERTFGPEQARRLEALDAKSREREFLRLWVRHEAELKWRGTGIGRPAAAAGVSKPWIAELGVGDRAAAAVAADAPPRELRCWDWQA
jgi:4'-phosphopantetheinyl transferase